MALLFYLLRFFNLVFLTDYFFDCARPVSDRKLSVCRICETAGSPVVYLNAKYLVLQLKLKKDPSILLGSFFKMVFLGKCWLNCGLPLLMQGLAIWRICEEAEVSHFVGFIFRVEYFELFFVSRTFITCGFSRLFFFEDHLYDSGLPLDMRNQQYEDSESAGMSCFRLFSQNIFVIGLSKIFYFCFCSKLFLGRPPFGLRLAGRHLEVFTLCRM